MQSIFSWACGHVYVFFGEISVHVFCPFHDWIVCFFAVEFNKFFIDQVVLQSCGHQDSVVLAQKQTHRSMEQNRESRSGPSTLWSTNSRQSRKDYNSLTTVSSISGAGKIGHPRAEE